MSLHERQRYTPAGSLEEIVTRAGFPSLEVDWLVFQLRRALEIPQDIDRNLDVEVSAFIRIGSEALRDRLAYERFQSFFRQVLDVELGPQDEALNDLQQRFSMDRDKLCSHVDWEMVNVYRLKSALYH